MYGNTVLTAVSLAIGINGSENALLFAQRERSARCALPPGYLGTVSRLDTCSGDDLPLFVQST